MFKENKDSTRKRSKSNIKRKIINNDLNSDENEGRLLKELKVVKDKAERERGEFEMLVTGKIIELLTEKEKFAKSKSDYERVKKENEKLTEENTKLTNDLKIALNTKSSLESDINNK